MKKMKQMKEKMKRNYKFMIGILAALLLAVPVTSSLAWLTASSDPVVNYFSGSTIALTLDEAPVDTDGKATEGDRVKENSYKYAAGAVLDKDPTVTILKGSEECYVYVCVDNGLPEDLFTLNTNTDAWEQVSASENRVIYRYRSVVAASDEDTVLTPIFTTVTISEDLTAEDIEELGTRTLSVTAFAIQTAGLDAEEADDLALAYFDGIDVTLIDEEEEIEEKVSEEMEAVDETADDIDEAEVSEEDSGTEEENTDSDLTEEEPADTEESAGTEEKNADSEPEDGTEEAVTPEEEENGETTEESTPAETDAPVDEAEDGNA